MASGFPVQGKPGRYLTPDDVPETRLCRVFSIPDSAQWLGTFMGALLPLIDPETWQQGGTLTPDEAADEALEIIWQAYSPYAQSPTCFSVPTPFWDEAQDVDDQVGVDDQIWYGEVDDPDAPPDEINFIDNAAIWVITGFIAYSGNIGAAIAFNTVAPRFVLAWRRGDVAEVIRVIIDAADYGTVDTSTVAAGEIIELSILPADQELTSHDILLVKVS